MRWLLHSVLCAICMTAAAQAAELLMVEQDGCIYCERWNAEIAPLYPETREGRFAPLRRVDVKNLSQEPALEPKIAFTPTFVLLEDGQEVGRLEGYPGADMFWVMIGNVMDLSPNYALTDP